jgi:hypothetical protein
MDSPNSQTVWITLIAGCVQVVLALIARADRNTKHNDTTAKIEVVRNDVNGKMSELLRVSGDARQAVGNLAGRAEEKANPS